MNHSLHAPTPRTQDLQPVIAEQSGLYVPTRELFERAGRIAETPYILRVDEIEAHDIDTSNDFRLAELILEARRAS